MSAPTRRAARADATLFLDAYETSGSSPGAPTLHLVGAGRVGRAFDRRGLDARALADSKEGGTPVATHPQGAPGSAFEALRHVRADVVVDATATDFRRPRWNEALDAAVTRGSALALASKDPAAALGHRWLTPGGPAQVGVNAALGGAGAGLRDDLAELRVGCVGVALAGSASTTTILSAIEQGGSFEDGVDVARARGRVVRQLARLAPHRVAGTFELGQDAFLKEDAAVARTLREALGQDAGSCLEAVR